MDVFEEGISKKLDYLADLEARLDLVRLDKQAEIDQILTPEIKAAIREIEAKYAWETEAITGNIEIAREGIKVETLRLGASVNGTSLQAVWSKGRVSWDTKKLDGYAAAHPEILVFKTTGNPSVSIRRRNGASREAAD